ncbi:MAG: DNA recombination protein RmuC [Vicinamibacterales bacterium]
MNLLLLVIAVALGTAVGAIIATVIVSAGARRAREEARTQIAETVRAAAADALHDNSSAFLDLARTSFDGLQRDAQSQLQARQAAIDTLVRPMTDTLRKVEARLSEAERERIDSFARLTSQVTSLGAATQTLAKALRTPSARGRWGEMQLRRVIELSGMLERCDFDQQRTLAGDIGRVRPDVVVYLPGGKQLVVDAKAPLDAFLDAQEAPDDTGRTLRLQAHARQVRDHMEKLGSKAYWDALGNSPEMVVMFLPGETLFSSALQHDLSLIEYGLERRVLLASPITLIALLTTVAHSWRQDRLTENYREVARLGRDLHDRLATFAGHFDDVRRRLDGAVQAYNSAAGSLESRVMVSARRLRELDITTADELPVLEPIDTVPRVLRQAGLMGLPEGAIAEESEPV